jgi:hypothetical protein
MTPINKMIGQKFNVKISARAINISVIYIDVGYSRIIPFYIFQNKIMFFTTMFY